MDQKKGQKQRSRSEVVESCRCPMYIFFHSDNVCSTRSSGVRSRLVQVSEVKVVNQLRCMSELVSQQPGSFFVCTFISGPMDEVQEFAVPALTVNLRVKDLFDLILSFAINVDQRWWSLYMIGDHIGCCRF